jgi:hypothetical protein
MKIGPPRRMGFAAPPAAMDFRAAPTARTVSAAAPDPENTRLEISGI